ncbi:hypothetical protein HY469_01030 [Candidatus Roizmanbacteria bacterium]|nr:hypothetical protein [Candidatus Roizmanbacteria bacterium]
MNYDGLLTCVNYSYPPNSLQYCGPDKTSEIVAYKQEHIGSDELVSFMKDFHTLYVYLRFIAHENNILDPFDPHVVEAYWIGNPLLTTISMKGLSQCLTEDQMLKKRLKKQDLKWLIGKIPQGAIPHHTFHVLNVFTRTGHHTVTHTLETMDSCRIGWGKIVNEQLTMNNKQILVKTNPLVIKKGKLALGEPVIKTIQTPSFARPTTYNLKPTTFISFHWNMFCDVLTDQQVAQLERYTRKAIQLANTTL